MSRLAGVDDGRGDASVAWMAVAAALVAAGVLAVRGDPDWAVLAALVAVVGTVPPTLARDPTVTFPGELVWVATAPAVVRALGAFPQATPFLAIAGLSLLAVLGIEAYSSLAMTRRFAVAFTVVATMAFAGVWAVGAWAADVTLGTAFVGGQFELMWDLTTATAMGVVAGVVFEAYFATSDRLTPVRGGEVGDAPGASPDDGATDPSDDADPVPPTDADPLTADGHKRVAVRAMQAVLAGITLFSLVRFRWAILVNAGLPLLVTFLPAVLRREYGYTMDAGLVLWVTTAVTLHAIGSLGPYATVRWYDTVTHTLSATLVAGVGYAVARAAELHTDDVAFSRRFRSAFVLLFVLAAGVLWELLEFASGGLASLVGGGAVLTQYGTGDIATDLLFDAVGGTIVAAGASEQFERVARAVSGRVGPLVGRG